MNNDENKKYIKNSLLTIAVIIATIILAYIINFYRQDVSKSSADWGAFGDYLGGVLNPVIALASLIVLGYISILISRNDSDEKLEFYKKEQAEKHKYFMLEKRIEVFQELNNLVEKTKNASSTARTHVKVNKVLLNRDDVQKLMTDSVFNLISTFKGLKIGLENADLKYGYLFIYDFSNNDVTSLIKLLSISIKGFEGSLSEEKKDSDKYPLSHESKVKELISKILTDIGKELVIKE